MNINPENPDPVLVTTAGQGPTSFILGTALNSSGTLIYSSSQDRFVNINRVPDGEFVGTIGDHEGPIVDLKLSLDDHFLLTSSRDGSVKMWSTENGQLVQIFEGHDAGVNSAIFLDDGIASASHNHSIRIWDRNGDIRLTLRGHDAPVTDLVDLGEGKLASSSRDYSIRVWDLSTGQTMSILKGHRYWVTRIRCQKSKGTIATTDELGQVHLWDWRTGEQLDHWHTNPAEPIWGFDLSADEKTAITSGGMAPEIWDLDAGKKIGQLSAGRMGGRSVSISGDCRLAALGSDSGSIRICKLDDHKVILHLRGHNAGIISSAAAHKNLIATGHNDGKVQLHGLNKTQQREFRPHQAFLYAMTFTPRSNLITSAFDGFVRCWNIADLKHRFSCEHGGLVFSVDAHGLDPIILSAGYGKFCLWDEETGQLIKEVDTPDHGGHMYARYTTDNQHIVTAGDDRTMNLWQADGAELIASIKLPDRSVSAICPVDKYSALAATANGDLYLADFKSESVRGRYKANEDWIRTVLCSADNKTAFTSCQDGTASCIDLQNGVVRPLLIPYEPIDGICQTPSSAIYLVKAGTLIQPVTAPTTN